MFYNVSTLVEKCLTKRHGWRKILRNIVLKIFETVQQLLMIRTARMQYNLSERTPSRPRKCVRYREVSAKKRFSIRFLINQFPEESVRYKEVSAKGVSAVYYICYRRLLHKFYLFVCLVVCLSFAVYRLINF